MRGHGGNLTVVLINVQDPSSPSSTEDVVTLDLPSTYRGRSQVSLQSAAPDGLSSMDAEAITLGGESVTPAGHATGSPSATPVTVDGQSSTVTVPPGTARIVTFTH